MNNLQELQDEFERYLFDQDSSISSRILSTEELPVTDRLAIYHNAYRARLVEALANDYPALKFLLGDNEFENLCLSYLKANPSKTYSLRWFGQELTHFLENHQDYRNRHYLAEMAEFEWVFVDAFDAKNCEICGVDDATNIPPDSWPELRIKLHPSIHLVTCSWNCLLIWQAMKNESDRVQPQTLETKTHYLIWRQGMSTHYRSLNPDEAAGLNAVQNGANFTELCGTLTNFADEAETALRAATLFKSWLASGLVQRLDYSG